MKHRQLICQVIFLPMNPNLIEFWAEFKPPKTTHQSKQIVRRGAGARLRNTAALNGAKAIYTAAFLPHRPRKPLLPPIALEIRIVFPHVKSAPKKIKGKTVHHTSRPDASNLAKTIEDILVDLGFLTDDAGVSNLSVSKRSGDVPGVYIKLETLEEQQ